MQYYYETYVELSGPSNEIDRIAKSSFHYNVIHPQPLAVVTAGENEKVDWRFRNWGSQSNRYEPKRQKLNANTWAFFFNTVRPPLPLYRLLESRGIEVAAFALDHHWGDDPQSWIQGTHTTHTDLSLNGLIDLSVTLPVARRYFEMQPGSMLSLSTQGDHPDTNDRIVPFVHDVFSEHFLRIARHVNLARGRQFSRTLSHHAGLRSFIAGHASLFIDDLKWSLA